MGHDLSKLDADQIIQDVHDVVNHSLRTNAVITSPGVFEVAIDQADDSISIGDGSTLYTGTTIGPKHALDVNIAGGTIEAVIEEPTDETSIIEYDEVTNVAANLETAIATYQVPSDKIGFLYLVEVSGENIAKYQVKLNGSVISTQRTYFGSSLNSIFDFRIGSKRSYVLQPDDIITVYVEHNRPTNADFESRIQLIIKDN